MAGTWSGLRTEPLSKRECRRELVKIKHAHQKAKQFFFILSGEAVMWIDGTVITLKSQEGCTIQPGIPHQIRNESLGDVEFIVISTPSTAGDRTAL